jgi:phage terminase small subunit
MEREAGDRMLENPKWEAFCLHYARTGNASEAYRNAGYTAATERSIYSNCNRLLKKDVIQARLREIGEELAADKIAGIREIQERLTAILRGELQEEHIVVEGVGDGCSQARRMKTAPALKDVINAAEKLGRMQGAFDNKLQVELTVPVFGGEEDLED